MYKDKTLIDFIKEIGIETNKAMNISIKLFDELKENKKSKKYSNLSYVDFTQNILNIKLTKQQELLLEMFEELKLNNIQYINPYQYDPNNTIFKGSDYFDVIPPVVSYNSNKKSNDNNIIW